MLRKHQRVANRHIGSGKPLGTQEFSSRQCRVNRTQPCQKPAFIVLCYLWLKASFSLHVTVAQHQGLRKGQRRIAHMQAIEVGAIARLMRRHVQCACAKAVRKVLTDGDRFRHVNLFSFQQRNGSQQIDLEKLARMLAWRKGPHPQFVGLAHFLQ